MKRYSRYITYVKPKVWYLVGALLAGLLFGASSVGHFKKSIHKKKRGCRMSLLSLGS